MDDNQSNHDQQSQPATAMPTGGTEAGFGVDDPNGELDRWNTPKRPSSPSIAASAASVEPGIGVWPK